MYTGELFGVEYLYSQTGSCLPTDTDNLDEQIDEDEELETDPSVPSSTLILEEHPSTVESESDEDEDEDGDAECHIIIFGINKTISLVTSRSSIQTQESSSDSRGIQAGIK